MIKEQFYETSLVSDGLELTDQFNNLDGRTVKSFDPCQAYYMGHIPANLMTSIIPKKLTLEVGEEPENTIIKFEDSGITGADWGYMTNGGVQNTIQWRGGNVNEYKADWDPRFINSMEAYKYTKWGGVTLFLKLYAYFDQTLTSGATIRIVDTSSSATVGLTYAQFISFVKEDTPISASFSIGGQTETYSLKYSELIDYKTWEVGEDRFIQCNQFGDDQRGYYGNTNVHYVNPFYHIADSTEGFGHFAYVSAATSPNLDFRIQFKTDFSDVRYYGALVGVNNWWSESISETNVNTNAIIYSDEFEVTGEILHYMSQNQYTHSFYFYNNVGFRWTGGSAGTYYQVGLEHTVNLRDMWTMICLHNKVRNSGSDSTLVYTTDHTIGKFNIENTPAPDRMPFETYPEIEPELQKWQKYGYKIEDDDYEPGGGDNPDDWDPDTEPEEDPNDYEKKPTSQTHPPLFGSIGPRYWIMSIDEFRDIYLDIKNIMSQLVLYYNDLSQNLPAALIQTFSGLSTSEETQFKLYSGFAGNNVLDAIGSVIWYPFDLTKFFQTSNNTFAWGLTTQTDFVSAYTPGDTVNPPIPPATGEQFAKEIVGYWYNGYLLEGGTCTYFKHYDNFIDYTPYCDAVLYIPYCGSVHIDPQRFAGHELKLRYLVDFLSGACLALVYRDDLIVDTLPGQIGINIPVSMENFSAYISQVQSANNAMNSAKIGLIGSTVSAATATAKTINDIATEVKTGTGIIGAAKVLGHNAPDLVNTGLGVGESLNQLNNAQYSIDSAHMTMQTISAGSSALASGNEQQARLVIYQPRWLDGCEASDKSVTYGDYGHTTGFACVENKKLNNFTGLTVAESIDTSGIGQATEKEKAMIQSAFKGGVYM